MNCTKCNQEMEAAGYFNPLIERDESGGVHLVAQKNAFFCTSKDCDNYKTLKVI